MPQVAIESAGNSLLKGILMTFKQRLAHQAIADYVAWSQTTSALDPRPILDSKSIGEI